jgi:A-factor type gamma-butyrolactone 1'-reductase (1S-forming)
MGDLLKGKVIIVTGAGGGIGEAAAQYCAQEGANVIAAGRTGAKVEAVAAGLTSQGLVCVAIEADVGLSADCKRIVDAALERFGRLDGAFNNAGIDGPLAPAADYPEDAFDEVININFKSVWNGMRFQIPAMLKTGGGAIVNNASALASVGQYSMVAYCGAKAGVIGLTKGAALDYGAQGIRANVISPGVVETPMMVGMMEKVPGLKDMLYAKHPIGRLGQPIEIARAVGWMLSDHSSFMLGADISVDGGYLAV